MPHECRVSGDPDVQRIPLSISNYTRGGDTSNPVRRPLPRPDRLRIIHADRLVLLDDPSAAFGCLPFESIAGQPFISRPLPHKAPKLFLPLGSLACLKSI